MRSSPAFRCTKSGHNSAHEFTHHSNSGALLGGFPLALAVIFHLVLLIAYFPLLLLLFLALLLECFPLLLFIFLRCRSNFYKCQQEKVSGVRSLPPPTKEVLWKSLLQNLTFSRIRLRCCHHRSLHQNWMIHFRCRPPKNCHHCPRHQRWPGNKYRAGVEASCSLRNALCNRKKSIFADEGKSLPHDRTKQQWWRPSEPSEGFVANNADSVLTFFTFGADGFFINSDASFAPTKPAESSESFASSGKVTEWQEVHITMQLQNQDTSIWLGLCSVQYILEKTAWRQTRHLTFLFSVAFVWVFSVRRYLRFKVVADVSSHSLSQGCQALWVVFTHLFSSFPIFPALQPRCMRQRPLTQHTRTQRLHKLFKRWEHFKILFFSWPGFFAGITGFIFTILPLRSASFAHLIDEGFQFSKAANIKPRNPFPLYHFLRFVVSLVQLFKVWNQNEISVKDCQCSANGEGGVRGSKNSHTWQNIGHVLDFLVVLEVFDDVPHPTIALVLRAAHNSLCLFFIVAPHNCSRINKISFWNSLFLSWNILISLSEQTQ